MRLVMCTGSKDSDVLVDDDGALLVADRVANPPIGLAP